MKLRVILLTVTILISIKIEIAIARILQVPATYRTINTAIDASDDGDTVLVSRGVFAAEPLDFDGKEIIVASQYIFDQSDETIDSTIIDAYQRSHVVIFTSNETRDSRLVGFTLRNGRSALGGGIFCVDASPTLSDLIISDNESYEEGGGIYLADNSDPSLTNVIIRNNTSSDNGGGIFARENCDLQLTDVDVSTNRASSGGGIYLFDHCDMQLENVTVYGNTSDHLGGGIACVNNCDVEMDYVCIADNQSGNLYGGGLYVGSSSMHLTNVTIYGNRLEGRGGGIFINGRSSMTIKNSIFWNNENGQIYAAGTPTPPATIVVEYCDVVEGEDGIINDGNTRLTWGDGNINSNPEFVSPESYDFNLSEDSPCRDTGDPESDDDPDGSRADMGAFIYNAVSVPSNGFRVQPINFIVNPPYPNPFNSTVTLSCELRIPSNFRIDVRDLSGRVIQTFERGYLGSGTVIQSINATNWAAGIYFAQFSIGKASVTQQLTLIK